MTDDPRNWPAVEIGKLTRVLGPTEGPRVMAEALAELNLDRVESIQNFLDLAAALSKRGGYAAMVGGLLSVHATIHRYADDRT